MDFRLGSWLIRPGLNQIVRASRSSRLTPKSMEVLVCLAKRGGEVVSKAALLQEAWPGTHVTDDAVIKCIGELRRVFGTARDEPPVIETISKRGYRVVAPVIWETGDTVDGKVGSTPIRRIAVLPLTELSGNPKQEYFADGMTEELITELAQIDAWQVISRTSVMRYKRTKKPLPDIARDLAVDTVLEGTVFQSGSRVRITAQLIEAATDAHLWSGSFERELSDVLWLQREIAQAVAAKLSVEFSPHQAVRPLRARTVDPRAYEAYLKGMFHLSKFTPEGFERGMKYLQRAVETDHPDPLAYAALALGYAMMGHDRFPDAFSRAKEAACRSLDLGVPLAEAYAVLAMVEIYWDWDIRSAGRDFRRALELNPSLAETRRHYSWYLRLLDQRQEGIEEMKRAASLDPVSPQIAADLAWQYLFEGQFDAALAEAEKSLEFNPAFAQGLAIAGWVYAEKGEFQEAIAAQQKAAETVNWKWPLGRTYALMGCNAEARAIAAEVERNPGPLDQWGLAVIYAALGDNDKTLRWLNAAYESRFSWMPWNSSVAVPSQDVFAAVRHDRRFQELIRRVALHGQGSD